MLQTPPYTGTEHTPLPALSKLCSLHSFHSHPQTSCFGQPFPTNPPRPLPQNQTRYPKTLVQCYNYMLYQMLCCLAPASASFQSQSGIGDMLSALSSELKRLDVRKMAAFASTCLDSDSYRELKEKLVSMEKCYRTELDVDDSPDSS